MGLLCDYYNRFEANPITNNNFKINAVSGTLQKTFRKSYYIRFEKGSPMEHFYFREMKPSRIVEKKGYRYDNFDEEYNGFYYNLEEIIVLQVMLCADNQYLVEAIDKKDYDEIFNNIESKKNKINEIIDKVHGEDNVKD